METAPLLECALTVILFVNNTDNDQHPKPFQDLLTSTDLDIAFAEAEAHPIVDIDLSLDRVVSSLAQYTSTTGELVEATHAVNRLRKNKEIEYLIPDEVLKRLKRTIQSLTSHKRKYEELLDQTDREARQRAEVKRISRSTGREERARRREGLRALEGQLDNKTRELVAAQELLRKEQVYAKGLKQSLECQICREELWDTVTGCGHLFGAECIKQWLEADSTWVEDSEGYLILQEPRCPLCRVALSEKDLKRVYI